MIEYNYPFQELNKESEVGKENKNKTKFELYKSILNFRHGHRPD